MYQTTISVDGMMCGHCELAVKEAITKAIPVKSAKASLAKGNCVITSEQELTEADIHKALDPTGYTFKDFKCEQVAEKEKKGLFHRK